MTVNSSTPIIIQRMNELVKEIVPLPVQQFFIEELAHPIPRDLDSLRTLWEAKPLPLILEACFALFVVYMLFFRRKASKPNLLPADLVDQMVDAFKPEPLVPPLSDHAQAILSNKPPLLEEQAGIYAKVQGREEPSLNLVTFDFLSMGGRDEVKQAAFDALDKYGCGSCGPRGFYGTIDTHVFCEQAITKFLGVEDTIIYSDSSSAVSSAIPAFSNKDDLLVVDEGCNDSILTGVKLARSTHYFFKHNDMEDLEQLLQRLDKEDKALRRKPQRRFIVIEGIYRNFGDVAPLDKIVALKKKYLWRLFVDESNSFGVLGDSGRGITEHFGLPVTAVEILVASMAATMASVGGFCSGTHDMVEHQRLNGAGYVFSASQPPFTATAAQAAVDVLTKEGPSLVKKLQENVEHLHHCLENHTKNSTLQVMSSERSPVVHLALAPQHQTANSRLDDDAKLRAIVMLVGEQGVLVTASNYVEPPSQNKGFKHPALPLPTIRLVVQSGHSKADMEKGAKVIAEAASQVLDSWKRNESQPAREMSQNESEVHSTRYGLRPRKK